VTTEVYALKPNYDKFMINGIYQSSVVQ